MKSTLLALVIACGPWLSAAASAQTQPPPPPAVVAQFLGLSGTQTAQFQQLLQSVQADSDALGQQIAARQQVLNNLLSASPPNPGAIGTVMVEIYNLQQQAGKAIQIYRGGFLGLLTTEQAQKTQFVVQATQVLPAIQAFAGSLLTDLPQ